jgi:hypothetical protein
VKGKDTEEEGEQEPPYKELDAATIKRIEEMKRGFINEGKHHSVSFSCD